MQKPSIPKGTRDFGTAEMARRNFIFENIKTVFALHGYSQIETPAMENLSTLLGKYGDEGDKLLFRVLNSGDPFAKMLDSGSLPADGPGIIKEISEKGLRYDLTVPFARYVVMHREDISFPFRRYQLQPVWRADRPQKGRYREFYQCDADVIGSPSQLCELDLTQIIDEVFSRLGLKVLLKINNRKALAGLAEICGYPDKMVDITVAIDKMEKVGLEAVETELAERGLSSSALSVLRPVLTSEGDFHSKIELMRRLFSGGSDTGLSSEEGLKGLEELEELFAYISEAGLNMPYELDLSLARGLNYYTGAIFEVKALDYQIGSICGGGRYDNLTGIFGLPETSGVGISFGADRIYDVMLALGKFSEISGGAPKLLFANIGREALSLALPLCSKLRSEGVSCVVYPTETKLKKQFDYADKLSIPFISINGGDELREGRVNIKSMSGEQKTFEKGDVKAMLAFLEA